MADGNILAPFQPKNHDHKKCVADAIAASPGDADAVLKDHGWARADFEARLVELAKDADAAAAYAAARKK